jgi:hypothetical protein
MFNASWAVAFFANFFVSVALPFRLADSPMELLAQKFDNLKELVVPSGVRVALEVALALTILHVVYALFFSSFYIKFALVFLVIEGIVAFVYILLHASELPTLFLLLGAVALIGGSLYYYYAWRHLAAKSAALMRGSVSVITANPAIFVTQTLNLLLTFAAILFYGAAASLSLATDQPLLMTAYFVFSGYWFCSTVGYSQLVISAGVTDSYTRTSRGNVVSNIAKGIFWMLGASAFCGFCVAFLRTLHWLLKFSKPGKKKKDDDDDDDDRKGIDWGHIVKIVFYYIAKFLLEHIMIHVEYISRNTLLYCSIFDIPLGEGHRLLVTSGAKQRWDALEQTSMIRSATNVNSLVMVLLAGALTAAIGWMQGYEGNPIVSMTTIAAGAMFVLSMNLTSVIRDVADTMFLLFAIEPTRAKKFVPDVDVDW